MNKTIKKLILADKRKSNRLTIPLKAYYSLPFCDQWTGPLTLEDISGGGLKFKSKAVLTRGTNLTIKVDLRDGGQPILLKSTVTWSRESHIPEVYNIGVTFFPIEPGDQKRFFSYLCDCILLSHINNKGGVIS